MPSSGETNIQDESSRDESRGNETFGDESSRDQSAVGGEHTSLESTKACLHGVNTETTPLPVENTPIFTSKRIQVFVVCAMTIFMNSTLRANLSINMICMLASNVTRDDVVEQEFQWTRPEQGYILSALYYGYLVAQLPAGYISDRYGAKIVLICCVGSASLCTVLTTFAARIGLPVLIFIRMVLGLSLGFIIPSNSSVWGKWAPSSERSVLIVFAISGTGTGVVFTMLTAGRICQSSFLSGWPLVNYIYGSIGFLTTVMIYFFFYDTPDKHPRITIEEKAYLHQSTGIEKEIRKIKTPWRAILKSPAIYAIVLAHVASNWGYYSMVNLTPTYISDVFVKDINDNGQMSAVAFVAWSVVSLASSPMADVLRNNKVLTTKNTRKLFQLTCLLTATICMSLMTFVTRSVSIALLVVGVGALGLAMSGFICNMVDVAPRHAGILMSISNTIATLPGILGPVLAGFLTQNGTREEWRTFFFISSGIFIFGSIIFGIFAEGEELIWAKENYLEGKQSTLKNSKVDCPF